MDFPNWFGMYADKYFDALLSDLAGRPGLRFLQVGAFTGDASVWMLDNVLTGAGSVLVDVDTWLGSDEPAHNYFDWDEVERVYDVRTAQAQVDGRLVKVKAASAEFFAVEPFAQVYDFAYIDGAHAAASVLFDGEEAFGRLRVGGRIAFDDYEWTSGKGPQHDPALGIDEFAQRHRRDAKPWGKSDPPKQLWFRKVA